MAHVVHRSREDRHGRGAVESPQWGALSTNLRPPMLTRRLQQATRCSCSCSFQSPVVTRRQQQQQPRHSRCRRDLSTRLCDQCVNCLQLVKVWKSLSLCEMCIWVCVWRISFHSLQPATHTDTASSWRVLKGLSLALSESLTTGDEFGLMRLPFTNGIF